MIMMIVMIAVLMVPTSMLIMAIIGTIRENYSNRRCSSGYKGMISAKPENCSAASMPYLWRTTSKPRCISLRTPNSTQERQ